MRKKRREKGGIHWTRQKNLIRVVKTKIKTKVMRVMKVMKILLQPNLAMTQRLSVAREKKDEKSATRSVSESAKRESKAKGLGHAKNHSTRPMDGPRLKMN